MRVRVLCVLCTTLAALLWVVAPAQAATPLSASITCDPVSGVVSTRLLGDLVPDFSYKIEFRTRNGSEVSNTGVERAIPGSGVLATVPVTTTGPTGFVDIAGYSKQWRASDFRFYTETVRVVTTAADGTFDVVGWEESFTDDPYYLEYQVTAEVKETKLLMVVGRSEAHCLYASGAE